MKQLKILVGVLCALLAGVIITSIIIDKKNGRDYNLGLSQNQNNEAGITTHQIDTMDSDTVGNSYTDLVVTQKEVALDNKANIVENPENSGEIIVDAKLSEDEWKERFASGLTTSGINQAKAENFGLYCYEKLTPSLKQLYSEIYLTLKNYNNAVWICSLSPDDIDLAFNCVMNDHPEIYYTNGYLYTKYTSGDEIVKIQFNPTYTVTADNIKLYNGYIQEYYNAYKSELPAGASDYEKIKYTYEFVIINTEYNIQSPENQNILSVFLMGESVCQGYAKAFQYLLQKEGIECTLVTGNVSQNEGHAWNLVKCNGAYYYVDCTWGDTSYTNQSGTEGSIDGINFDYLNITTADIEKTHFIDNCVEVPECVNMQDNYYVKEGLYFTSVDQEQIAAAFNKASYEGRASVELKCADANVYNQMGSFLLDESHIFDYLSSSMDKAVYVKNQDLMIYSFAIR